jgi:hypothetical protein
MTNFLKPPLELRRGYKNLKHLGKVAEFPCRACRIEKAPFATRLNVHHKCGIGDGKKASDYLTFTICDFHHQKGGVGEAIHKGVEVWEKKFGKQDDLILEIHAELGITIFKDYLLTTNSK